MKILILSALIAVTGNAFAGQPKVVQVASLTVKERIQSIEEINVTAKNQAIDKPANNTRIERILAEAQRLEGDLPDQEQNSRK